MNELPRLPHWLAQTCIGIPATDLRHLEVRARLWTREQEQTLVDALRTEYKGRVSLRITTQTGDDTVHA